MCAKAEISFENKSKKQQHNISLVLLHKSNFLVFMLIIYMFERTCYIIIVITNNNNVVKKT